MSPEASSTVETEPSTLPLSTVFCADDADVVIRAAGTRDFRAHKIVLSLVSPIFKDMFTIPQPPIDALGTLPHVDVVESAETWENILRTVYPMPNPVIGNLNDLASLLLAAKKYEMQFVTNSHLKTFESRRFIQQSPLHLYAIACACELEDQARYVARNAELLTVMRRADAGDLRGLTVGSYHSLISFLTQRDKEWGEILDRVQTPHSHRCHCYKPLVEMLYNKVRENLKVAHFLAGEVYLKALEDRSRSGQVGCSEANCVVADSEIKTFVDRAVGEREKLCCRLIPRSLSSGLVVDYSGILQQRLDFTVARSESFVAVFFTLLVYGLFFYGIFRLLRYLF